MKVLTPVALTSYSSYGWRWSLISITGIPSPPDPQAHPPRTPRDSQLGRYVD
jgi:hypothetical protein